MFLVHVDWSMWTTFVHHRSGATLCLAAFVLTREVMRALTLARVKAMRESTRDLRDVAIVATSMVNLAKQESSTALRVRRSALRMGQSLLALDVEIRVVVCATSTMCAMGPAFCVTTGDSLLAPSAVRAPLSVIQPKSAMEVLPIVPQTRFDRLALRVPQAFVPQMDSA